MLRVGLLRLPIMALMAGWKHIIGSSWQGMWSGQPVGDWATPREAVTQYENPRDGDSQDTAKRPYYPIGQATKRQG